MWELGNFFRMYLADCKIAAFSKRQRRKISVASYSSLYSKKYIVKKLREVISRTKKTYGFQSSKLGVVFWQEKGEQW